jgi:hypothetical protein
VRRVAQPPTHYEVELRQAGSGAGRLEAAPAEARRPWLARVLEALRRR